ncbi:nucleic acid/nucleotide deaminase domain-containing protein [Glycomyces sp. NRRL B-16210]|uniref:nucleic acid/nucleotide deaminase domain-containing protein n=1 Tax=Glycomyces sp. NRRL B-16210 TaxID=1463821 RepID=UPI000556ADBA|nr:nucleic acid/nucleotide deaminase domain-containing protein [Glycomyces sp. NRRL B-16210]
MSFGPDLPGIAFERRRRDYPGAPSPIARNYAAAALGDGSVVTGRSRGSLLHAEIDVLRQASAVGSPVAAIYTERQPCCECEAALEAAGVAPDAITYSAEFFDTPGEPTAEDGAELARLNLGVFEHLRQMIREAEGSQPRPAGADPAAALARSVAGHMERHGLRVAAEPDLGAEPGVELAVDGLADGAGGVHVSWHVGADLTARVLDAVHGDRLEDPALTEAAAIKQHRLAGLAAVLDEAGIAAEPVTDGTAPYSLHLPVHTGPR